MIHVTNEAIDLDGLYRALESPHAGGTVVFTGTVRDLNAGKQVHFLDFEAYPEMAVRQMQAIADEITSRWEVTKVAMIHRLGHAEIGEMVVAIGVSAPHRDAAFQGCRHGIDRLKEVVPIWKRETFEGGEAWLSNHP